MDVKSTRIPTWHRMDHVAISMNSFTLHFVTTLHDFGGAPTRTIQLIEFTYCHDIFPEQALMHKNTKYDPLINTIQNNGWKTKPLITITARVRGAIH